MSSEPLGRKFISSADSRKLILSVADELSLLYQRYQLLSSGGYAVLSATDGANALQLFADYPIDLVVMDYDLPEMDGGLVAQAMKEYEPNVPIIMVSRTDVPAESLVAVNRCLRPAQEVEYLLDSIHELMKFSVQMRTRQWRAAG